jgi:hypothetical protein
MNSGQPPSEQEAILEYFPGDYHVVRRGGFVTCAVTGTRIPLGDLKYWSAELQEPYATSQVASQRYADWLAGKLDGAGGESK